MTIAGFTFNRMLAEKKAPSRGSVSISTNIGLISAEEIDFVMGTTKQKGIKIIFDYRNTYTPDLGMLIISGDILYLSDQKRHDELMKEWGKSKTFPPEMTAKLYDQISLKSTVQAIMLSSTVGLPPPIPLPRFNAGKPQEQEAAAKNQSRELKAKK